MADTSTSPAPPFAPKTRVRSIVDLQGVPVGSEGEVVMVVGIDWQRCRVRFDNGVEKGMLDAHHLEAV